MCDCTAPAEAAPKARRADALLGPIWLYCTGNASADASASCSLRTTACMLGAPVRRGVSASVANACRRRSSSCRSASSARSSPAMQPHSRPESP